MLRVLRPIHKIRWSFEQRWAYVKLCFYSLFSNSHLDKNYASDVCMEPLFWFVDNFTQFLGPMFVVCVVLLMISVIAIAYIIGLPYWWKKNPHMAIVLVIVGNWLKINTLFHYYMGVVTHPGLPPKGVIIQEAVSICRKCIAPKPPRTHHCSVCNRCILKMDHHCPWLNNCVGHFNHRYFFMYMIFISLSTLFIMIFGVEIAFKEVWLQSYEDDEIYGHPVKINDSVIIPVAEWDNVTQSELPIEPPTDLHAWRRRAITYMAFICSGAFVALTWLSSWHGRQIASGETSIEAHINKAERKRLAALSKAHINPYDFGVSENWKMFLLGSESSWLRVLFPSTHRPLGNGLTWDLMLSSPDSILHEKVT